MRSRSDCQDSTQDDSSEWTTVSTFDVSDQLTNVTVQAHIFRAFQLLLSVDESRDN